VIGLPLSRDAGHDEIWGPRDQNHGQPPSSPTQRCFDRRFFGTSAPRHYDVFTIVRSKLPYTKEVLVAVGAEIGLAIVHAEVDLATAPASPPHPMTELPKRR
jgi:hypothetical protein